VTIFIEYEYLAQKKEEYNGEEFRVNEVIRGVVILGIPCFSFSVQTTGKQNCEFEFWV
jgi:hypothetical protein